MRTRCAECGAEIADPARICTRCGAPVVAQWLAAGAADRTPSDDLEMIGAPTQNAVRPAARTRVRQVVLALVPVVSLTTLAWVPFLWLALFRRRSRDWEVFAAYALALAVEIAGLLVLAQGYTFGVVGPWLGWVVLIVAPVHTLVVFSPRAAVPSWRNAQAGRSAGKS